MVLKGLLAGGMTMAVAAVFPETLVYPFFAAVLGLVAGVYPGLAMADPMQGNVGTYWFVALLVLGLGLVGLWISPALLAGAWLLHGLWAVVVGARETGEEVPEGLPGFSLAFALVSASFVTYLWLMGS